MKTYRLKQLNETHPIDDTIVLTNKCKIEMLEDILGKIDKGATVEDVKRDLNSKIEAIVKISNENFNSQFVKI